MARSYNPASHLKLAGENKIFNLKVKLKRCVSLASKKIAFFLTDHYIVINLHQDGKIIDTKETKVASGPNPIWNAPFLFDLPPGDITQLPLALEFIVMQV